MFINNPLLSEVECNDMIMKEIYKGHEVIHDTLYDALHAHMTVQLFSE